MFSMKMVLTFFWQRNLLVWINLASCNPKNNNNVKKMI
jgi:hypothetical protein